MNEIVASRVKFGTIEAILLLLGFVVVSVVFACFIDLVHLYDTSVSLPMISIAGITLLLICLTGITYVFSRAGLQDKSQALGLPPGSIQAVIALSLIVLFAILSVYVFTSIGSPTRELGGLSGAERDAQIPLLGTSFAGWKPAGSGKFTIYIRDPGMDARSDVGKQLIVLIGTLMTSAVSFYFGSRAAAAGAAEVTANLPRNPPGNPPAGDAASVGPAVPPAAPDAATPAADAVQA